MTNLSRGLRDKLAQAAEVRWPEVALTRLSSDGTIKFLLKLADGRLIESVLIPGGKLERYTLCLSTQVGCPMACTFCNTGLMGFERNLTQKVADVMTASPVTIREDAGIDEAVRLLTAHKIKRLPVLDEAGRFIHISKAFARSIKLFVGRHWPALMPEYRAKLGFHRFAVGMTQRRHRADGSDILFQR
jgi:hypothetical protein